MMMRQSGTNTISGSERALQISAVNPATAMLARTDLAMQVAGDLVEHDEASGSADEKDAQSFEATGLENSFAHGQDVRLIEEMRNG